VKTQARHRLGFVLQDQIICGPPAPALHMLFQNKTTFSQ
jgi:hypothetical protein